MAAQYRGKRTTSGSSGALRIESAFFRSHPEATGAFSVAPVAPSQFLISFDTAPAAAAADPEADPMMLAFLDFLDAHLTAHPEDIVPLEDDLMAEIEDLVGDPR